MIDNKSILGVAQTYRDMLSEAVSPIPTHPHDAEIHRDAVKATDQFHSALKAKGYTRQSSNASAEVEHKYTRGNHSLTIGGWHGTGKYGNTKTIHGAWDNHKSILPGHLNLIDHWTDSSHGGTQSHFTKSGVQAHKEIIAHIHDHIAKLK